MRCPQHPNSILVRETTDPGIVVLVCPDCGGQWMSTKAYWAWRETLRQPIPNLDQPGEDLTTQDSKAGKLCPDDGAFLIRHCVGHGLNFHLDRCGQCGGFWLDAGEWETLKQHNLHDDLHLVFTSAWQAEVKKQSRAEADERLLLQRLNEADYEKATAIRRWIESHPEANLIQSILDGQFEF